MGILPACMPVCHVHAVPLVAKKGIGPPGTGVTEGQLKAYMQMPQIKPWSSGREAEASLQPLKSQLSFLSSFAFYILWYSCAFEK